MVVLNRIKLLYSFYFKKKFSRINKPKKGSLTNKIVKDVRVVPDLAADGEGSERI